MDKCTNCGSEHGLRTCGCGRTACQECISGVCRNCAKPICRLCEKDEICGACLEKEKAIIRRYETALHASWSQAELLLRHELSQNSYLSNITKRLQQHLKEKDEILKRIEASSELTNKKAFFTAAQELEQVPNCFDYKERVDLQELVKEVMETVEEYILDAQNREFSNLQQALRKYQKAAELISDHPVILEKLPAIEKELTRYEKICGDIRAALGERKFFLADKLLKSLPFSYQFQDRDGLSRHIETEIKMAKVMFDNIKSNKNISEILKGCRDILEKVKDYVEVVESQQDIEQKKDRLKKRLKRLKKALNNDDLATASKLIEELRQGPYDDTFIKLTEIFEAKREAVRRKKQLLHLALAGVALAVLLALTGHFYLQSRHNVQEASRIYRDLSDNLLKMDPLKASSQLEKALSLLERAPLTLGSTKEELEKGLHELKQSERFKRLIAGYVVYEGKYIPKNLLAQVKKCSSFLKEADRAFQEEDWRIAEQYYSTLLSQCNSEEIMGIIPVEGLDANLLKSRVGQLKELLEEGRQAIIAGEFARAEKVFGQAKDYYIKKELQEGTLLQEIESGLKEAVAAKRRMEARRYEAELTGMVARAQQLLEKGDVGGALKELEACSSYYDTHGLDNQPLKDKITAGLKLTRVAAYRKKARRFLESGEVETSQMLYRAMVTEIQEGLKLSADQGYRARLKGLLIDALKGVCNIAFTRADYESKKGDYHKAGSHLDLCQKVVLESGMGADPAVSGLLHEVKVQKEAIQGQEKREKLKRYLLANAARLFPRYLQSVLPAEFSNFQVSHFKSNGDTEVFHLSAEAKKRSITVHCVLECNFNTKENKWTYRVAGNEIEF